MSKSEKIKALLDEHSLDAILVSDELNQRYITGYKFSDGLVLVTRDQVYMLTDFRYEEEAKKYAYHEVTVTVAPSMLEFISDKLSGTSKRIGYEDAVLPCAEFSRLKGRLPDFNFFPISNALSSVREIKDASELECIAEAQNIADAAFDHILSTMTPEMTEIEVALELEFFMRRHGAEGVSFETIAVSGDASALPHGKARNLKLRQGFLTMDFGAIVKGYCSDMTRTVVIGRANEEMRRLYDTVLCAQERAFEEIREGADCTSVDAVARDIINSAGYAGCFGHGLGHGVGMYIHEAPRLSPKGRGSLRTGHVVTVEPGIYISGSHGCRIEDMVAVTPNGYRNFTRSKKELIELF